MAKLNKQKFNLTGFHNSARSTFGSDINIHLYFNTEHAYFYFDKKDLKEYFEEEELPNTREYFGQCDTKQKAVDAMAAYITRNGIETKYLRIKVGLPSRFWKMDNPNYDSTKASWEQDEEQICVRPEIPEYLSEILKDGRIYVDCGLGVEFERVIKLEVNNSVHYVTCNEKWEYNQRSLHGYKANIVGWTQEREDFLIGMQVKLDDLSKMVLDYLNAGDDINNFFLRMETPNNLLGTGE